MDFYEEHFINSVRRLDIQLVAKGHKADNEKFWKTEKEDEESGSEAVVREEIKNEHVFKRVCELHPDYYFHIKKY